MKTKITFLIAFVFLGSNIVKAQGNEEDLNTLSIFSEYAKAKNYDAAYGPWMEIRKRNPKFNRAIFTYGEKILKYKIENSTGAEQVSFIEDLVLMWGERRINFASKTPKGKFLAMGCQLQYDNRKVLNMSDNELYECYDNAYKTDEKTFTNPKSLYTYFKLMVNIYDAGIKPAEQLFIKYDEISEKVESEVKNYTQSLNRYVSSEENEQEKSLSSKERKAVKSYTSFLTAYAQIRSGMDKDLGDRANCENLIPLYNRNYEENKNDGLWLQRAMNRMAKKECTDDPLFVKIVEQKNSLEPNADTAYYLGFLKEKNGNDDEALAYYNQAVELQTDNYEKGKILYKIGAGFKKKGFYGQARSYYQKALAANPSMGKAYLAISQMYASSAKNCGTDNFSKRAVYWLAAKEARKAGRVDSNLRKASSNTAANYMAKAPSKGEVFESGRSGETLKVGCWIGRSVKVPKL